VLLEVGFEYVCQKDTLVFLWESQMNENLAEKHAESIKSGWGEVFTFRVDMSPANLFFFPSATKLQKSAKSIDLPWIEVREHRTGCVPLRFLPISLMLFYFSKKPFAPSIFLIVHSSDFHGFFEAFSDFSFVDADFSVKKVTEGESEFREKTIMVDGFLKD
jgi:hypothetical protein